MGLTSVDRCHVGWGARGVRFPASGGWVFFTEPLITLLLLRWLPCKLFPHPLCSVTPPLGLGRHVQLLELCWCEAREADGTSFNGLVDAVCLGGSRTLLAASARRCVAIGAMSMLPFQSYDSPRLAVVYQSWARLLQMPKSSGTCAAIWVIRAVG